MHGQYNFNNNNENNLLFKSFGEKNRVPIQKKFFSRILLLLCLEANFAKKERECNMFFEQRITNSGDYDFIDFLFILSKKNMTNITITLMLNGFF